MSITLTLLLSAWAGSAGSPLTLRLEAPKPKIVVAEPLKLTLTWTATRSTEVVTDEAIILLDDGTGYRAYHETVFGTALVVHVPQKLGVGEERKTAHVLAVSGGMLKPGVRDFSFAFPRPGKYRAKASYDDVESNEVRIEVTAPKNGDAEILAKVQKRPDLLSEQWAFLEEADADRVEALVNEHPDSPILSRQRIGVWKRRLEHAHAQDRYTGKQPVDGEVARVLQEIESTPLEGTPFDEDRLLVAAEQRTAIGDRKRTRQIYEERTGPRAPCPRAPAPRGWPPA